MRSPPTTAKSPQSRRSAEMMAAASIRNGSGPQKYAESFCHLLSVRSVMEFGPYCARRRSASADDNPSREDFSRWNAVATSAVADVPPGVDEAAGCSLVMARPELRKRDGYQATRLPFSAPAAEP